MAVQYFKIDIRKRQHLKQKNLVQKTDYGFELKKW